MDTATPFLGNEAAYPFQDEQPAGSTIEPSFGGVLPIGNVHEPSNIATALMAGGALLLRVTRQRVGVTAHNDDRSAA